MSTLVIYDYFKLKIYPCKCDAMLKSNWNKKLHVLHILHKDIHITCYSSYYTKCFIFITTIIINTNLITRQYIMNVLMTRTLKHLFKYLFLDTDIASSTEQV